MDVKALGYTALGWMLAILFAISGVGFFVGSRSVVVLLTTVAVVALCAPLSRAWLQRRTGIALRGGPLALACFVLLLIQGYVGGPALTARETARKQQEEREAAERVAKIRNDKLSYFEQNKASVLADIAAKLEAGQLKEALAESTKYISVSKDPDLARAKRQVDLALAKAELDKEATLPLARRAALYATLADGEPSNAQFVQKAKELAAELAAQQAAAKAAQESAARMAARAGAIKSQFSGWDGSHLNLTRSIKASMKNPDSYEHVETRYRETSSGLVVTTTFRGTNSFGAIVPNTVIADIDDSGNVLSMRNAQ